MTDAALSRALELHRAGQLVAALAAYGEAALRQPSDPNVWRLAGLCHLQMGDPVSGLVKLEQAADLSPRDALALSNLATCRRQMGQLWAAEFLYAIAVEIDPSLTAATSELAEVRRARHIAGGVSRQDSLVLIEAERGSSPAVRLRNVLFQSIGAGEPSAAELNWLGILYADDRRFAEADASFRAAAAKAPANRRFLFNRAKALFEHGDHAGALEVLDEGLIRFSNAVDLVNARTGLLREMGRYEAAVQSALQSLAIDPAQFRVRLELGNLWKTLGDLAASEACFREATMDPACTAEAYWSLSNLKILRFTSADVTDMKRLLADPGIDDEARVQLEFALAKALEDEGLSDAAFAAWVRGNSLRRRSAHPRLGCSFDRAAHSAWVDQLIAAFDPATVERFRSAGDPSTGPIFIVSLPRSGSTLIDQILSAHSSITGTDELGFARQLADRLMKRHGKAFSAPGDLSGIPAEAWYRSGRSYLETVRSRYGIDTTFFTDKMPNNFEIIGFILAMLPNARIVNCARDPIDTCLANYRQLFARGQEFSYDLEDLGSYYRDYVRLMAHWRSRFPGRIFDISYEGLLADQEGVTRNLLEFVGLTLESACLAFHKQRRAVPTASAAQVRQPLYRSALARWRLYEPHLGGLIAALGPLADGSVAAARADSSAHAA